MPHIALLLVALASFPLFAATSAPPLTEDQKITKLIESIRTLNDATFIRNGKEYTATAAADHLQMKRNRAKNRIKTARDFIQHLATSSSQSGQPYLIRFNDKSELKCADYLTRQLEKLESPTP